MTKPKPPSRPLQVRGEPAPRLLSGPEQDLVVRGHYKANMVVMNIGGFPFTTGPTEAAYVVNDLVRPASVIASHANEPATVGGKLSPTSRTATFQKAAKMPVHVPLKLPRISVGTGGWVSGGSCRTVPLISQTPSKLSPADASAGAVNAPMTESPDPYDRPS